MQHKIVKNAFDLQEPDEYRCKVWVFTASHQNLKILVEHHTHAAERILLEFDHVQYFSGPTIWRGANFTHQPMDNEHKALLQTVEPFDKFNDIDMMDWLKTYDVFTVDTRVKIIAGRVYKLDYPGYFYSDQKR